jgi:threonine/homoserine/homoserine lactone efflux protein
VTTFMAGWLTVFLVGCLAVMSPGPNMAMALKNSLAHSRRAGVSTAAGLALGDAMHVSYCLVGIAVVISRSILLFDAIKWVGAAYLVYVGVRSLRASRHTPDEEDGSGTFHPRRWAL